MSPRWCITCRAYREDHQHAATLWDIVAEEHAGLMTPKPDERDVRAGERLRDAGMSRTMSASPDVEEWRSRFEAEVARLLRAGVRSITSEDVTGVIGLPPGSRNRIGATMRAVALQYGLHDGGTRKASRVARHAGRVTVWRSAS